MFFKILKYMNWFASQCRKVMYNMAFGTQFRYFGKACTLEINDKLRSARMSILAIMSV